jgi:hypothetical protein
MTKGEKDRMALAAMLEIRGRFSDGDISDVAALALVGLVQQKTDAA